MTLEATKRLFHAAAIWLLGAVVLWLVAAAADRRTEVLIENLGDHFRFEVAGTELVVPTAVRWVDEITLWNSDSIQPPRVRHWEIIRGDSAESFPLPPDVRRFDGDPVPIGDWWVDAHGPTRKVATRKVALEGDFGIRVSLTGRTAKEFSLTLSGEPTLQLGLRRGLMDNYMVIRDIDGNLVDVTTLDPTPGADLGALFAQLLRGLAAGCLVILFIRLVTLAFPEKETASPDKQAGRASDKNRGSAPCSAELPLGVDDVDGTRTPTRRSALQDGESGRGRIRSITNIVKGSGNLLHKTAGPIVVVLALAAGSLSAWVAVDVLGGLPHQIDEVVYLLQARWLLDGEIAPAATAIQEHHRVPFTYLVNGRWIGHYPVGWPAILAVGLAVGVPHLVTSALGAIFVLLVFLVGRELDDELTGLAAAILATISPLIRTLSSTMFPHLACVVLVTLTLWLLLLARNRPGWWWGAGAGLAMGCCLAIRPMTAVAVSVVLGGWLAREAFVANQRRPVLITIGSAVAAGLLASLPTLVHNTFVAGNALSLPYSFATGAMYDPSLAPYGIRNLDAILVSASSNLFGWGWPFMTGGLALALPLALVAVLFLLRRSRPEDLLLLVLLAVVALGHLPTRAHGLHGFGARYVVDVAACFVLLSARGIRELARWAQPSRIASGTVVALFLLSSLSTMATLPKRLALYRGYDDVTGKLELQLDATGATDAVILIDDVDWRPWAESSRLMTGARRHEIAIGADLDDNSVITGTYPRRPVFFWDGERLLPDDRGHR